MRPYCFVKAFELSLPTNHAPNFFIISLLCLSTSQSVTLLVDYCKIIYKNQNSKGLRFEPCGTPEEAI